MEKNKKNRIIIAIAGPSASGKTHLSKKIIKKIGKNNCTLICQDNYYKNLDNLSLADRKRINFDNPRSFDFRLLIKHLKLLKIGNQIQMPVYNFVTSTRLKNTRSIYPKNLIILEGLLPFFKKSLCKIFDFKIYIETDNAICFSRRIKRDSKERGDSIESVCLRYFKHVLPMQKKYVEPQKKWADLIING